MRLSHVSKVSLDVLACGPPVKKTTILSLSCYRVFVNSTYKACYWNAHFFTSVNCVSIHPMDPWSVPLCLAGAFLPLREIRKCVPEFSTLWYNFFFIWRFFNTEEKEIRLDKRYREVIRQSCSISISALLQHCHGKSAFWVYCILLFHSCAILPYKVKRTRKVCPRYYTVKIMYCTAKSRFHRFSGRRTAKNQILTWFFQVE